MILICCISCIADFPGCQKEAQLPILTTYEVTDIKSLSANAGGNITDDGGKDVYLRGVCWGTVDNPTIKDFVGTSLKGTGGFARNITGLTPDTYYHLRAFAMNSIGTAYGNEVHFRTKQVIAPKVTTITDSLSASFTSIRVGGEITIYDEIPINERGFCSSTYGNPTTGSKVFPCGSGSGRFEKNLDQLQPGTLYYVRAYAVTVAGVTYGDVVKCYTLTLQEIVISEITSSSVRVDGKWKLYGYGNDEFYDELGVCYGTDKAPTIEGHSVELDIDYNDYWSVSCVLEDLTPGTLYYIRTYVITYNWYKDSYRFVAYGKGRTFSTSQ